MAAIKYKNKEGKWQVIGADGTPGSVIYHVNGSPESSFGALHDWAIESPNGRLWEKTEEARWTNRGNIGVDPQEVVYHDETSSDNLSSVPLNADTLNGSTKQDILDQVKTDLDNAMTRTVNPNLLDNWYFVNPVNQRGLNIYDNGSYTIDRWKCNSGLSSESRLLITNSGITIENKTSTEYHYWQQKMDSPILKKDSQHIISILTSSGELYTTKSNINPTPGVYIYQDSDSSIDIRLSAGISFSMAAIKWELGDRQTLAHLENDKWVLNEIPDYGEQLRRCQRYYQQSWTGPVSDMNYNGQVTVIGGSPHGCPSVRFPVIMASTPAVTIYNPKHQRPDEIAGYDGSGLTGIYAKYLSEKGFSAGSSGEFTIGKVYVLHYTASCEP